MSDVYRIFGIELSPFSVKIRSYFRFKQIPHRWIVRNSETMADYQKYAKIPIVPLVVTPDEQGHPGFDTDHGGDGGATSRTIRDASEKIAISHFVSLLLEEFGDEWGNKWMFHLRWAREEDRLSAGRANRGHAWRPGETKKHGSQFATRSSSE